MQKIASITAPSAVSTELSRPAQAHINQRVKVWRFGAVDERSRYNGICACVSLLGVTDAGLCPSRQRDHTARHADASQGCCSSGSPSGRK